MAHESLNGKKLIQEELIRGHDMANQLLEVLVHKSRVEETLMLPLAQDLVHKVLISFTNTLLLLNNNGDIFDEEVVAINDLPSSMNCTKSLDLDEAYKSTSNTKHRRRGCNKRKLNTSTWERDSSILSEDGHAWRKYGQKMTATSKYLKCTHKFDQGCSAIKQVQRIQKDPPLYRTTYYGHHTCKSTFNPDMIFEPDSSSASSILLSFNNSFSIKQEHQLSSLFLPSEKQEPLEVIHDNHIAQNQMSSSDYLQLCEYELDFDYWRHINMLSSTESVQFDNGYGCSLDFIS
ncbi:PREDICTED: probable WRKY transcription factor 70 isoform X2 [Lupinus angustifolius]|uniref:probable WRKY transcription factor 70 isoform X2 n=1 Tax=Lupinus angustifolius TaxID=3871 RepID=UPI00092EEDB8|nr:PREDICTED: probable WRKY transcription factor 70 isoform X2 [Lupinus angustifolius]